MKIIYKIFDDDVALAQPLISEYEGAQNNTVKIPQQALAIKVISPLNSS